MTQTREIVCLANSYREHNRCVAGVDRNDPTVWIRPIANETTHPLREFDRRYRDGLEPRVLDVVAVGIEKHTPVGHQKENHTIRPGFQWRRVGTVTTEFLRSTASSSRDLWGTGSSTSHRLNDRIPCADAERYYYSLSLIHVESLNVIISEYASGPSECRRHLDAGFHYDGKQYILPITDPAVYSYYKGTEVGQHPIGESYLTVSLGLPFNGYCYKIVAAVIRNRGRRANQT